MALDDAVNAAQRAQQSSDVTAQLKQIGVALEHIAKALQTLDRDVYDISRKVK